MGKGTGFLPKGGFHFQTIQQQSEQVVIVGVAFGCNRVQNLVLYPIKIFFKHMELVCQRVQNRYFCIG